MTLDSLNDYIYAQIPHSATACCHPRDANILQLYLVVLSD